LDAGARPQNRTLIRGPIPVEQAAALDAADLGCRAQASIAVADKSAPTVFPDGGSGGARRGPR